MPWRFGCRMPSGSMLPSKYAAARKIPQWDNLSPCGIPELPGTGGPVLLVKGIPPLDLVQFF